MLGHTPGRSRSSVPYVKKPLVASTCCGVYMSVINLTMTEFLVILFYGIQDLIDHPVLFPLLVRTPAQKMMPYTRQ